MSTLPDNIGISNGPCLYTIDGITAGYYWDYDGDGYGSLAVAECSQQSGQVSVGGDCNDAVDAGEDIYPGDILNDKICVISL